MGTRNLTIVVIDGQTKIAQYGQWDGYPNGQGITVLEFIRDKMKWDFRDKVRACSWITEDEYKTLWEAHSPGSSGQLFIGYDIAKAFSQKHPELSRDTAAQILEMVQNSENGLKLQNNEDFLQDGLFCEWAYKLDLDEHTLTVYSGFHKGTNGNEYETRPIKTYKFLELVEKDTKEFVKELTAAEEAK